MSFASSSGRTLGFSIEEARELLALWRDKSRASADVKRFAMKHVRDVETKIDELQAMSRTLRHLAQTCHGDNRPECPILADLALPGGDNQLDEQSAEAPRLSQTANPTRSAGFGGRC